MGYGIIQDINLEGLAKEADERIKKGWIPSGGITLSRDTFSRDTYLQVMWKPEESIKINNLIEEIK